MPSACPSWLQLTRTSQPMTKAILMSERWNALRTHGSRQKRPARKIKSSRKAWEIPNLHVFPVGMSCFGCIVTQVHFDLWRGSSTGVGEPFELEQVTCQAIYQLATAVCQACLP